MSANQPCRRSATRPVRSRSAWSSACLQVEPAIDAATREGLARAQPLIESACAATATPAGLRAMSETVIPAVMGLILESTMTAEQKQAAVVAITTARLLILSLPVTPEATP
jgi:hypothetical protein